MNIQPLQVHASRAEELDALRKVARLFPEGTYMHDLFSNDLIEWVNQQMKVDFPPDVFGALNHTAELLHRSEGNAVQLGNEVESLKKVTARNIERLDREHAEEVQRLSGMLETSQHACDFYERQSQDNYDEAKRLQGEWGMCDAKLRNAEAEIMSLKAKLYDLMSK